VVGRPRPEDAAGFRAVLARTSFRRLWIGQVFAQLADKFLMFALLVFINQRSGIASAESLLMIAYTLPSVFLSSAAGVYADRHDKRQLMVGTNLVRAAIVMLVPLFSWLTGFSGGTWLLLIPITLAFSSVGQVFAPAEAASIPSLVSRDQIMGATSLFMTTVVITLVLGVPLASLCIAATPLLPFYIGAFLFVVAAASIWRIPAKLKAEKAGSIEHPDLLRELKEGLAVLRGVAALRLALVELTVALVVVFTLFALGPSYMTTVLHRNASDTYIVLIPATLGIIIVASVLGQGALNVRRSRLVSTSMIAAGAMLTAIGVIPAVLRSVHLEGLLLPATVAIGLCFGAALGVLLISAFTVLQEATTPESRGRIFGGIFAVINAAIAVPLLLAGVLADVFHSAEVPLGGLGVILLAGGVAAHTKWQVALQALDRPGTH
jgi:MFS family permease